MQVSQANKELQGSLIPSSQELVECVADCHRQFEELRARVLKLAESFAVSTPTPEKIFSLKVLESLLQDVTEAQKRKAKGGEFRQIAQSILRGTGALNPVDLPYLIWQLLREEKLGIAFHLARRLEIQSPDLQPRLPSWLIRALVVGRHMRSDVGYGELAKTLMTNFANSDSCFVDGEDEWNQALSLLLAASGLRPALLAPNTGAASVLHSLRLGEGLNQLHEYCQTIANYGAQLQLLDVIALKKVKEQVAWQQALEDLRQKVEHWHSYVAPGQTMNSPHATIELQEYHQGSSNDHFQQQAQQLKQAVSNRQQAVLKELNSFEQRNSSVLVLAGICCCRTVVEDIQDSFRVRRCVTNGRA